MNLSKILRAFTVAFLIPILGGGNASAVPAYPRPITVTQVDGTPITVRVYGDERFNYTTTSDGYNVVSDNGIFYYATMRGGKLVSTGVQAKNPASRTAADRQILNSVSYGVPYAAMASAMTSSEGGLYSFGASPASADDPHAAKMNAMRSSGEEFRSLVILVQFPDKTFSVSDPRTAFSRMLNEEGYMDNNATGSARDYYVDNSNGKFNPHFDVVGPYTLSRGVTEYTGYEGNFIVESCNAAQDAGVDFSRYVDNGVLRDVFIFFAGYNNAEVGGGVLLHPARMFFENPNYDFGTWGGGRLLAAAYTSELKGAEGVTMAGIGTFCHEFGHILGWPDLYDSDYSQNGTGFNLDIFSLMASGSYVNEGRTPPATSAYERYMIGWADLQEITEPGEYELEPVYNDKAYIINTVNEGEFFVFEYRDGALNKWDRFLETGDTAPGSGFPATGSGSGMLVYHIDRSDNVIGGGYRARDLWGLNANKVNAFGAHECLRFVMASPVERNGRLLIDFGKIFFPGTDNVTSFTSSASPSFVGWNGLTTGLDLYNIQKNGTSSVSFEARKVTAGTVQNVKVIPSQFDIFVSFTSLFPEEYTLICREEGGKEFSVTTLDRAINFAGLTPGKKYTVSIYYGEGEEPIESEEVVTAPVDKNRMPTLNIGSSYGTGEPIALQYLNVQSAVSSVKWSVDNEEVEGTVIKLSAGLGQKIMAEITTSEGVEYLVKYVNVN